jgi:hypothetical protein
MSDLLLFYFLVCKYQFGPFDSFDIRSTYMIKKDIYTKKVIKIITSIDAIFPNNP